MRQRVRSIGEIQGRRSCIGNGVVAHERGQGEVVRGEDDEGGYGDTQPATQRKGAAGGITEPLENPCG